MNKNKDGHCENFLNALLHWLHKKMDSLELTKKTRLVQFNI